MFLILAVAAMLAQPSTPPKAPAPKAPVWKFVAMDGPIFTFYVPPEHAGDKKIYAEIVRYVMGRIGDQGPFQADFFDDESKTPTSHEYTDENRAHQRARFNFNPANGMKRFLWIRPADPANPKGKRIATEDTLPLDEPAQGSSGKDGGAKGEANGKEGE